MTRQMNRHNIQPNATLSLALPVRRLALVVAMSALGVATLAGPVSATPAAGPTAPTLCVRTSNSGASRSGSTRTSVETTASVASGLPGDAYLVKDINSTGASMPEEITDVGSSAFFSALGAGGRELWKSDGTDLGTVRVRNIRAGAKSSFPSDLTAVGSRVFFAATDSSNDRELWVSDGTSLGTTRVKDINTNGNSNPTQLANVGGTLFFAANGAGGRELYKSDGTSAGTTRVKDLRSGPNSSDPEEIIAVGNIAFFSAFDKTSGYRQVWRSDGTGSGTRPLNAPDGYDYPTNLTRVGERVYFTAESVSGCAISVDLYRTDGTNAGTFDVTYTYGDDAFQSASLGGRLYFAEYNELSRVNQAEDSSVSVKSFNDPVTGDQNDIVGMVKVGARLFLMVDVWVYDGSDYQQTDRQLWKSNGTASGTKMIVHWGYPMFNDPQLTNVDGELFFSSTESDGYSDVWRSNGTTASTMRVADIGNSYPDELSAIDGSLYFSHDDGFVGRELWRIVP